MYIVFVLSAVFLLGRLNVYDPYQPPYFYFYSEHCYAKNALAVGYSEVEIRKNNAMQYNEKWPCNKKDNLFTP